MKVILLAFANSQANPLEHLTREDRIVYDLLSKQYFNQDYIVQRESFTTPERLNDVMEQWEGDIAVFHYSGHAGKDELLMGDRRVFPKGIARQLAKSVENGSLKLVILNGCSTWGQVSYLLEMGVPAIVSTNAPVGDKSASEFSIRFWRSLKTGNDIQSAYEDGLNAAQTLADRDISGVFGKRHLVNDETPDQLKMDDKAPLWRLDALGEAEIQTFPIPYRQKAVVDESGMQPNESIIETLYNSFSEAGNPKILDLVRRENEGGEVTISDKQIAILNSIPFPIGTHLQKLICPVSQSSDEGYDVFGFKRLKQTGQLFQITTEFLAIIMIAQVWELYVRFGSTFKVNEKIKSDLSQYLNMTEKQRELYDYIPLILEIKEFLSDLRNHEPEVCAFLEKQDILKSFFQVDETFLSASRFLLDIRESTLRKQMDDNAAVSICIEAETQLCRFLAPLGFIHRYYLTSVQNIDIMKLRHINKENTDYKHQVIRCMQAIGKDERNYYLMKTFLDNWGVILLKSEISKIPDKKGYYRVEVKDFLNLSPFVIDRNSFIPGTDLVYIMFFNSMDDRGCIHYKKVNKPLEKKDSLEIILPGVNMEDRFEAIRLQLNAFRDFIA